MKTQLRAYQKQILSELADKTAIALFMGTGSGKTLTSLAKVEELGTSKLLVICPKSVIPQWEETIRRETPRRRTAQFKKTMSAAGKNKYLSEYSETYDTVVINFEIAHSLPYLLAAIDDKWAIIVDESHRIKSPDTTVTKAILKLGRLTDNKIILTATPTQGLYGGYIDYFSQLKFLGLLVGYSKTSFEKEFCVMSLMTYRSSPYPIKVISGYQNTGKLNGIINSVSRRYTAKAHDFDPSHIKITIDKPPSYNRMKRDGAYRNIALTNNMSKRVAMKTLTGGIVHGYTLDGEQTRYEDNENKAEWLKDFLNGTESSVVIFYQYNAELEAIKKALHSIDKSYVVVNGDTNDKMAEIKKDVDCYVGQYQAMSESIDGLQHKSHIMIFYSLPESSLLYKQALGRIDRIGQVSVPTYYYLVMKDTIDSDVYDLIEKKVEFSENDLERIVND